MTKIFVMCVALMSLSGLSYGADAPKTPELAEFRYRFVQDGNRSAGDTVVVELGRAASAKIIKKISYAGRTSIEAAKEQGSPYGVVKLELDSLETGVELSLKPALHRGEDGALETELDVQVKELVEMHQVKRTDSTVETPVLASGQIREKVKLYPGTKLR